MSERSHRRAPAVQKSIAAKIRRGSCDNRRAAVADIVPFSGIRYDSARVSDLSRVLAPPYDVIGEAERAELEARHPQNVVRIELPRGDGDARYAEAARLLGDWMAEGSCAPTRKPAFYVYEQQFTLPRRPAGSTRAADSSRPFAWSRSNGAWCCRTRRRWRRRRRIASS